MRDSVCNRLPLRSAVRHYVIRIKLLSCRNLLSALVLKKMGLRVDFASHHIVIFKFYLKSDNKTTWVAHFELHSRKIGRSGVQPSGNGPRVHRQRSKMINFHCQPSQRQLNFNRLAVLKSFGALLLQEVEYLWY